MRDHQIKNLCETIARRGPWGAIVRQQDDKGQTVLSRISFAAALRHLSQEYRTKAFPMQPRATKGARYVQYPLRRRDGTVGLGPRMIVPA